MSLLIKDVQIIDGSGDEPYKADVLVQKNIISAIGELKSRGASETINGLGHYLTPGFVDIDTESDHYLSIFTNPEQNDFINQGVTTTIGGNCGASLAPLLYGTLESTKEWGDPAGININWHTMKEFLDTLEKLSLGVNFGTLAGHTTIRQSLVGEGGRRLFSKEMEIFKNILRKALEEGAFGMSSGLGYVHGQSASKKEIRELIGIVSEFDGVYATHMRSETKDLLGSIDETIRTAKEAEVKTVISHLQPFIGYEEQFEEGLKKIEESAGYASVHFDIYPFDVSARSIYTLLPEWAQTKSYETMLNRIKDKKARVLIRRELSKLDPSAIRISGAPDQEYLIGKTLAEIAKNMESAPADSLLKVMEFTGLKATVFYKNINEKLLMKTISHPMAFIASNGSAAPQRPFIKHERSKETFPRYLEIVLKNGFLSLPHAIRKITSRPAQYFGITKRGMIKEGNIADLVILDKNDHKIKQVIIGGKIIGDKPTSGEILRHKKY